MPVLLAGALLPVVTNVTAPASAATTQVLPFQLPSTASLRASAKKVFVNWVPSLPISIDNKPATSDYWTVNYQNPNGEGGSHRAYGGYSRDRPLPRSVSADTSWKLADMEQEVRQAASMGADGFSTVLYTLAVDGGQVWNNNVLMMQAAAAADPGFKIILQPDMSSNIKSRSQDQLAASMAQLGKASSAYHLSDGRLVISPFNAESHPASWWSTFLSIMKTKYGITVAFLPLFQNEMNNLDSFAPISYGLSNWGNRNPAWNNPDTTTATSPQGRIGKVHAKGIKWMQPISAQDERPRSGTFQEALNTENLRDTWKIAIETGSELVQLNTWNDYPEGSQMAPSQFNGWGWLDISSYYLTWFKTGKAPTINKDTVYLTHRQHAWNARPSFPETKLMTFPSSGGGSAPRDSIEALSFLTSPGTVTISVGGVSTTCSAPAGPSTCLAPLRAGTVTAKITRGAATTASLTSPFKVVGTPYVQDLHYTASSSGREGTSAAALPDPTATASPTATATATASATPSPTPAATTTRTVGVAADAAPDAAAPARITGSKSYLTGRGSAAAWSFLRFVLPAAPAGTTLKSATLQLRTTTDPTAGSTVSAAVRLGSDSWTESTLTWANHPTTVGAALGTIPANTAKDTAVSVPLSVSGLAAQLGKQTSLTLTGAGSDALYVWSREAPNAGVRPVLVLVFG